MTTTSLEQARFNMTSNRSFLEVLGRVLGCWAGCAT